VASIYRVLSWQELFHAPGFGELFNQRATLNRLQDALNRMSVEGWELVSATEHVYIFRHDGATPIDPLPPAGMRRASAAPYQAAEEEPIDPDADLRDETNEVIAPTDPSPERSRIPILHGDLIKLALAGRFDAIVHGCNCRHTMGGGIARQIKNAFPEAEDADLATEYADRGKLGTLSTATIVRDGRQFFVVNAYTQFEPGADANYDAIRSCFREIKRRFAGTRIGYPRIGAGIGGGDWAVISAIIDEELTGEDHTLVEYQPG
jgi:O-acetyl-ADP-ribose deacetylase (regulator of RNase III)